MNPITRPRNASLPRSIAPKALCDGSPCHQRRLFQAHVGGVQIGPEGFDITGARLPYGNFAARAGTVYQARLVVQQNPQFGNQGTACFVYAAQCSALTKINKPISKPITVRRRAFSFSN